MERWSIFPGGSVVPCNVAGHAATFAPHARHTVLIISSAHKTRLRSVPIAPHTHLPGNDSRYENSIDMLSFLPMVFRTIDSTIEYSAAEYTRSLIATYIQHRADPQPFRTLHWYPAALSADLIFFDSWIRVMMGCPLPRCGSNSIRFQPTS
jgi:hypothetical protein